MSSEGRNLEVGKIAQPGLPGQELDALKRHICQILGFDVALIDIVRNSKAENVFTFFSEEAGADYAPDNLVDKNGEPLSVCDSKLAEQVRKQYTPYVGRAYTLDDDTNDDEAGFPYIIVSISDGQGSADARIKGMIRAISFDNTRKIDTNDVSNVRLIGQHLATRLPHLYLAAKGTQTHELSSSHSEDGADSLAGAFDASRDPSTLETVLVAHSNRAIRRRLARTLGPEFNVIETDEPQKIVEEMGPERDKEIALVVLDSQIKDTGSGEMYCKVLKDLSPGWKHTPILLVVPEANAESKVEGLNAGADDCVIDSCLDAELLARVRSSLRLRKTERELATQLLLLEEYAQKLEYVTEVERLASSKIAAEQMDLKVSKQQLQILRNQDLLLRRVSDCIRQSFNIDANVNEMLADLAGWLDLDSCFIVLTEECDPQDIIRQEYSTYDGYRLMDKDYDVALLEIFQSLKKNEIVLINDVKRDKRVEPFKEILSNYLLYSVFYVPITYEEKLLGILGGHKCESQAQWTTDNEAFLRQVAVQVAIGVTNARLYKRVERQATTDGLTGLFNHRTGQEKLAEQLRLAERYSRNLAVVMMDIDHFKSINDTFGHPVGDTVLKSVAHIIRRDCRDVDIPVRYGGEEFLLVLPEVNQEGAVVVAERLRKTLQRECINHDGVASGQLSVTASIGIAAFPEDASSQHVLLELADKALYMSKRLGRNQVHTAADLAFHEFEKARTLALAAAAAETTDDGAANEGEADTAEPDDANAKANADADAPEQATSPVGLHIAGAEHDYGHAHTHGPVDGHVHTHGPVDGHVHTHGPVDGHAHTHGPVDATPALQQPSSAPQAEATAEDREGGLVPEVVEMVKAMAGALYAKSDYNKVHHLETARFAEMVAKVLGLNQRQVEQIRVAGLLHDVGLLSVPEEIINKPGQVTAEELRVLMQHPMLGAQMFRPIAALKEICDILENHHECWDGTGYPRGLRGEEIPLAARIVAIVDAYHAMISDRPYRPAMSKEKAKRVLRNGAGSQFDPFLVDIFLAVLTENEEAEQTSSP